MGMSTPECKSTPREVSSASESVKPSQPRGGHGSAGSPVTVLPEIGGPSGPEPTRFGDWERNGRCIDF
jgi:hypothetical protein